MLATLILLSRKASRLAQKFTRIRFLPLIPG